MGFSPRGGNGSYSFPTCPILPIYLYDGNVAYENVSKLFKTQSLLGAKQLLSIKKAGVRTFPSFFLLNPTATNRTK